MTCCRVWNIHSDRQIRRGCLRSGAKCCTSTDKENTRREYCFYLVSCLCDLEYRLLIHSDVALVSSPAVVCGTEQRRALAIPLVPPDTVSSFSNADALYLCGQNSFSHEVVYSLWN